MRSVKKLLAVAFTAILLFISSGCVDNGEAVSVEELFTSVELKQWSKGESDDQWTEIAVGNKNYPISCFGADTMTCLNFSSIKFAFKNKQLLSLVFTIYSNTGGEFNLLIKIDDIVQYEREIYLSENGSEVITLTGFENATAGNHYLIIENNYIPIEEAESSSASSNDMSASEGVDVQEEPPFNGHTTMWCIKNMHPIIEVE